MTMPLTYNSEALAAVHEMIEGLHEAGAIDKRTLREFDEACLAPATPDAEDLPNVTRHRSKSPVCAWRDHPAWLAIR